jgi:hypothetical protein
MEQVYRLGEDNFNNGMINFWPENNCPSKVPAIFQELGFYLNSLKLSPIPPSPSLAKELGGWFSSLTQPDLMPDFLELCATYVNLRMIF